MKNADFKKGSFTKKISTGLTLSFERLVETKKITNAKLAFSQNGKIVKVNARDISLK